MKRTPRRPRRRNATPPATLHEMRGSLSNKGGRRNTNNGGAVSSGAGGRSSGEQWKQEGEDKADDETDSSAPQEAERDPTSHASGEAWQYQVRAGSWEKRH
ncbi:hypothetical protein NDU88_000577 [Pleurodeles waltl]|uniref:Uncharacterized protein n=1 Tax=Pleurodeles waltl TaxID=8319 RepID=A0AAV7P656_PLEWA|nr:hypothetical protein NDU88_000577 [Pleurodeles waltl]